MPRMPMPSGPPRLEKQETFTDLLFPGLRIHYGGQETSIEKRRNFYKKHKKSAKTLGIVVGGFLFCWLPFFLTYLIHHLCNGCIVTVFLDLFTWLGYSNSAINPVIYAATWKTFRDTFWRFLHKKWCVKPASDRYRQQSAQPPSSPSLQQRLAVRWRAWVGRDGGGSGNPAPGALVRKSTRRKFAAHDSNSSLAEAAAAEAAAEAVALGETASGVPMGVDVVSGHYHHSEEDRRALWRNGASALEPHDTLVEANDATANWLNAKLYNLLVNQTATEL